MSFWVLVQILLNMILIGSVAVVWVRLSRPAKDDPRLSKGLQLLQSKISVLEDLSDRTETQVSQLTALIEQKCRDIQDKIVAADKQIARIDASAQKSLEVAQIFQDRIPHSEILERQNTIKYVTAARLAHQGASVEQISSQVDLSRAEIEFIAKVNREKLQFSEADLPDWARVGGTAPTTGGNDVKYSLPRESFQATPPPANNVGQGFTQPSSHQAPNQQYLEIDLRAPDVKTVASVPTAMMKPSAQHQPSESVQTSRATTSSGKTVEIRPVQFPRIRTEQI